MAVWTTSRTWVTGELVTVGMFNQQVRDNMVVLKTSFTDAGKLRALTSSYVANLSGSNLTYVVQLAAANAIVGGEHNFGGGSSGRFVAPVGDNRWAT